ncbi:MAG: glycoside hydrolase family 78 protein [Defluviitaleaceae bacterium]|nr:glycoside hydrolase family 78 protein [Defluviitaleaceae bacterium]
MTLYDLSINGTSENPRFSWKSDTTQTAYRLRVSSKEKELWDSGIVKTGRSWYIPYEGMPLPAFNRIFWKVEVFTDSGSGSASAQFTTGRLETYWPGEWFEAPKTFESFPLFRRMLNLEQGWEAARIYICGLGAFHFHVNGEKISDAELEPGWTNFDKRVPYVTYDLTTALRAGENELGIMLGGGMYSIDQKGGRFAYSRHSFGTLKATMHLVVEYPGGKTVTVSDAKGWETAPGPLTFSCIYGGEDYDARLANPQKWQPVSICEAPKGEMFLRENPPVVVRRRLSPVTAHTLSPEITIYDLGRNFAGRVRVTAKGKPGQTLRMHFAELLTPEGKLLPVTNFNESYYHDYTFASHAEETYAAHFTYYGFRYVQVETTACIIDIAGEDMFSDMPSGGTFCASNNLWNRTHDIILRAIESNAKSVFTDCPHREKLGWLEQLHLIGPGILSNFDAVPMLRKCLADMREAQLDNGMMPTTAPEYRIFDWMPAFRDSPEWGSSCILLVKQMYNVCGDESLISENYDMMRRYADYLVSKSDHMILRYGLGDWDDVDCKKALSRRTPVPITVTCTLYMDLLTVAWAAEKLGKKEEALHYSDLASQVKHEFNKEFFIPQLGQYATGSQTSLALPLAAGMVEEQYIPKVLENLIDDVREHGNHLTGGDGGHNYLFEALGMLNRSDVVADIIIRKDYPSYGFHLAMGATSLPEQWSGSYKAKPHGSQNHFMMGGIDAWFYRYLAGVKVEVNQVRIAPHIVHSCEWVDASLETVCGPVRSKWQIIDESVEYHFEIPAGADAEILVHGHEPIKVKGQKSIQLKCPLPTRIQTDPPENIRTHVD